MGLARRRLSATNAWRQSWAELLAGRCLTVVTDCDASGRRAAEEIATSLRAAAIPTEVVDV
jgi:hypothetical protein